MTYAYEPEVAFECAGNLPRDPVTGEYILAEDILEYYARLVAYKVAHNLKNGFVMNPNSDPLDYIECGEGE